MGSFFKECGCSRPTRCPHPYTIRFRDALGKQREEAGFGTQDDAVERLTQIYAEKKKTASSVAEARRELGQQTVAEYAKQWRPRQRRMTEYSTGWHVDSSINVHIVPRLGSRKLNSVTPIMVECFLDELEADGVGRGNQVNIFRTLKAILRDAYGKGAMADDPVKGVQEPEYVRQKVVIPPLAYVKKALTAADEDLALEIVMMVGCGLRNGEARAVNVNNVVADDVYRVHEQIHSNTHKPAKLKHRKAGEFREVPLPRSVRERWSGTRRSTAPRRRAICCAVRAAITRSRWSAAVCRGSSRTSLQRTVWGCTASGTTSPRTPSGTGYRSPTWRNGWGKENGL